MYDEHIYYTRTRTSTHTCACTRSHVNLLHHTLCINLDNRELIDSNLRYESLDDKYIVLTTIRATRAVCEIILETSTRRRTLLHNCTFDMYYILSRLISLAEARMFLE